MSLVLMAGIVSHARCLDATCVSCLVDGGPVTYAGTYSRTGVRRPKMCSPRLSHAVEWIRSNSGTLSSDSSWMNGSAGICWSHLQTFFVTVDQSDAVLNKEDSADLPDAALGGRQFWIRFETVCANFGTRLNAFTQCR